MHVRHPTHPFALAGQQAWFHDEGFAYGPVHTYDALQLPGSDPRPRKVQVLVPWTYGQPGVRFPVVYMNDGQTTVFAGGIGPHSWRVAQTLGDLTARRHVEPVIVVSIHPLDRDVEYTHAPWFPGKRYGGLEVYGRYIANSLKPWIDSAYQTQPEATRTAAVGSSHGGLAAFVTALQHPQKFGWIGALSPSFWVGRGRHGGDIQHSLRDSDLLRLVASGLRGDARPRIWIDWGLDGDGARRGAEEMADLLPREFGYLSGKDLWVHADPQGGHNEQAWAHRFGLVMETFFGR